VGSVAGLSYPIFPRVSRNYRSPSCSLTSAMYSGERKEGRKDRKREISNYRDFPFWNSIPNVIVLASRAVDRTLILRRCEIASPRTLNSPSLHSGKWIVNIYEKERFYPFFEFTRQSLDFVQEMKRLAFFGLKEKNIYSERKSLLIRNI